MSRPSKYKPEFVELAYKIAVLGADDKRLVKFFGCGERQLNIWKKQYPEFGAALKKGKDEWDAEVVKSLYHRAMGYSHKAVKVFFHEGQVIEHEYVEHYPPDTAACIFWLKNRQPDHWRDQPGNTYNVLQISGAPNDVVESARQSFLKQATNCGVTKQVEGAKTTITSVPISEENHKT